MPMQSSRPNPVAEYFHKTFSSLKVRNFRLYYIGQAVSVSGTFMQGVAQAWLVLKLTDSGTALGIVTALQYLPVLIFGPWGGVLADRFNKRKLIYLTQTVFAIQALLLGTLVLTGAVQVWMVGALAFLYGLVNVIDNPTRQTFVPEMVGTERLRNAVTLYSMLVNLARVLGPIVAAVLIVEVGVGLCFIINGFSYAAIIILLAMMRASELHKAPSRPAAAKGQMIEGLKYILRTPVLRNTLLMMAVIGTLTYEFQVSLPLLAEFTFHGNAATYADLTAAQGIGSVIGGLFLAGQKSASTSSLLLAALLFGTATITAGFMPTLNLTIILVLFIGFFSIYFQSLGNTILQLNSDPKMRGRVMSYWTMAFLGSTAIGGPLIGWIGQTFSPRFSLGVGGLAAIAAAAAGYFAMANKKKKLTEATASTAALAADNDQRIM